MSVRLVRRPRLQARVFNGAAGAEMVKASKAAGFQAKNLLGGRVEEAPDARAIKQALKRGYGSSRAQASRFVSSARRAGLSVALYRFSRTELTKTHSPVAAAGVKVIVK